MKIGIYDPYLDTMSGGERYMLSIATALAGDHDVRIFWDTEKEAEIRLEADRKFAMKLEDITFTPNIFEPHISLLRRLIESRKYDRIFVLSDGSIPILACPMILHFQTPTEWVKVNPFLTELKLMRTKRVICNSYYTKRYIDKKYKVDSTVLYPPVTLAREKSEKKEHIILNVGRYGIRSAGSSYKKQEVMAQAFSEMVKKGLKDWELVFIMSVSENEAEKAKAFADSFRDLPITVLLDPDLKTVSEYYRKASIYWHASGYGENLTEHPDRAEHFGISTVEAMSYGAVPIVINAGGQPEIVSEDETGFLWGTFGELQEKTEKIIRDVKLRKRIAEAAEKRAKDFDVKHFQETLGHIVA
jgi:glycosyltransferase involved in cell wall biosynthesis